MDPITHTLTGFAAGNAFWRKDSKAALPDAVKILMIAANLPDVDALMHITGDPNVLFLRRTFGHSIFLFPVWSALLACGLRLVFPHLKFKDIFQLGLVGCFMHLFFDLVNSFGVVPFWPLSNHRFEFAIIFIVDLALTALLAFPLLSLFQSWRPKAVFLSRLSSVLVSVYVLLCFAGRGLASNELRKTASRQDSAVSFSYVFPEPLLGPLRWHGVARAGNTYYDYSVLLWPPSAQLEKQVETLKDESEVEAARQTAVGQKVEWLFKAPVWELGIQEGRSIAVAYDLRFNSPLLNRRGPFDFLFDISDLPRITQIKSSWPLPYSGLLKGLKKILHE